MSDNSPSEFNNVPVDNSGYNPDYKTPNNSPLREVNDEDHFKSSDTQLNLFESNDLNLFNNKEDIMDLDESSELKHDLSSNEVNKQDFKDELDDKDHIHLPELNLEDIKNVDESDKLKQIEDDILGLFEDSDELENYDDSKNKTKVKSEEEDKVLPLEISEVIDTNLNKLPIPDQDNLVVCKFPPTLLVSCNPNTDIRSFLRSNPYILENPPNLNNTSILYWKFNKDTKMDFDSNLSHKNENKYNNTSPKYDQVYDNITSNCKLILFDDNTYKLFVGKIPLDIETLNEMSFLIEDSKQELKPVHAQIDMRFQTRFSNLLKNEYIKKNVKVKRQKMEVTSLSEAITSKFTHQQNYNNYTNMYKQKKSTYTGRGLTKNFLESSDTED